ncbi:three-Cys-motif partner protein TcmP [Pedobacter heparinus]|uniref:three-Cys-motif partner protein TcmP n=1 Tax=Pedobacter heparinus TaxID=984 RepID=UPI002931659C|nr:three-Cys-motif partner protein TcmP [Pedobacter heparinus]
MNKFGGNWTDQKIDIVTSYAKAYLTIMNKYDYFKLIYFDGFAGSGEITAEDEATLEGAAVRVLTINDPKSFDLYYFVELDKKFAANLETTIRKKFPEKKSHVVAEDCNVKLSDLVDYLQKPENKYCKVLAFIDPKGMQVNWNSLEILKGYGIDLWILVPIGMGVNRLLKKDGIISDEWITRLEKFLGMTRPDIMKFFYNSKPVYTLFGEEIVIEKEQKAIDAAAKLYQSRLKTIFKFVSEPFVMRNSMNSPMYHFYMATNNKAALTIANDVIKPKYK